MKTYKIHLIRHGITEANQDGRYIGRTDLPGGDTETLMASLRRLDALEEDYTLCPGHSASTKLAREKQYNPFIKRAKAAAEQEA